MRKALFTFTFGFLLTILTGCAIFQQGRTIHTVIACNDKGECGYGRDFTEELAKERVLLGCEDCSVAFVTLSPCVAIAISEDDGHFIQAAQTSAEAKVAAIEQCLQLSTGRCVVTSPFPCS